MTTSHSEKGKVCNKWNVKIDGNNVHEKIPYKYIKFN